MDNTYNGSDLGFCTFMGSVLAVCIIGIAAASCSEGKIQGKSSVRKEAVLTGHGHYVGENKYKSRFEWKENTND